MDGKSVGIDEHAPFTHTVSDLATGVHAVFSIATDEDGSSNETAQKHILIIAESK